MDKLKSSALEQFQALVYAEQSSAGDRNYVLSEQFAYLYDIAGKLHRIAEKQCNFGLSGADKRTKGNLKSELKNIESKLNNVDVIAANLDPRGAPVKLWIDKEDYEDNRRADITVNPV